MGGDMRMRGVNDSNKDVTGQDGSAGPCGPSLHHFLHLPQQQACHWGGRICGPSLHHVLHLCVRVPESDLVCVCRVCPCVTSTCVCVCRV